MGFGMGVGGARDLKVSSAGGWLRIEGRRGVLGATCGWKEGRGAFAGSCFLKAAWWLKTSVKLSGSVKHIGCRVTLGSLPLQTRHRY